MLEILLSEAVTVGILGYLVREQLKIKRCIDQNSTEIKRLGEEIRKNGTK